MDQMTFGETPAAQYLVHFLNEGGNDRLNRSVSKRIVGFNNNVAEILACVESQAMSCNVATNLLRLLRKDACGIVFDEETTEPIVTNLVKNVVIGKIKHAIRILSVGAVVQRKQRTSSTACLSDRGDLLQMTKNVHGKEIEVPVYRLFRDEIGIKVPMALAFLPSSWIGVDTTTEVLHERSIRRQNRRKGK